MQSWYNCRDIKSGDFHSPWYKLNRLEIPPVPYILYHIYMISRNLRGKQRQANPPVENVFFCSFPPRSSSPMKTRVELFQWRMTEPKTKYIIKLKTLSRLFVHIRNWIFYFYEYLEPDSAWGIFSFITDDPL